MELLISFIQEVNMIRILLITRQFRMKGYSKTKCYNDIAVTFSLGHQDIIPYKNFPARHTNM